MNEYTSSLNSSSNASQFDFILVSTMITKVVSEVVFSSMSLCLNNSKVDWKRKKMSNEDGQWNNEKGKDWWKSLFLCDNRCVSLFDWEIIFGLLLLLVYVMFLFLIFYYSRPHRIVWMWLGREIQIVCRHSDWFLALQRMPRDRWERRRLSKVTSQL